MLVFISIGAFFIPVPPNWECNKLMEMILGDLVKNLPPIISRDHIEKLLGGIISAKTLANLDSLGKGPKRMTIGRKVAYRTEHLLEWLEKRTKILN